MGRYFAALFPYFIPNPANPASVTATGIFTFILVFIELFETLVRLDLPLVLLGVNEGSVFVDQLSAAAGPGIEPSSPLLSIKKKGEGSII